ncbi:relaxase/mobilization nuclease domain-containing protein [Staphylococcus haemolyticus]|uniref:relaxase/mobilization nuclease domain-containing protein n=1 Tax=Staphylococcus haemolyticus TaxID=1283 RepID=UPI001F0AFAD9|nr:relaxase/mobilization nuclease domain-containing protein [Staphylococcus haemolyticus]
MSSTRNVQKSIDYVLSSKPHYDHEHTNGRRVQAVSGLNLAITGDSAFLAKPQMRDVQKQYHKDEGYIQGYTIIDSYSEDEIPKDGKRSTIQLVHEMGLEKARRIYGKNYQCLVVTQCDGKSGLYHNHLISNAVGADGKSQRGDMTKWTKLAEISDQVMIDYGYTPLNKDNWRLNKTRKQEARSKGEYVSPNERKAHKNGMTLAKDEVREQIQKVIDDETVKSFEDFKQMLNEEYQIGVEDAGTKDGENIKYSFSYTNKKGETSEKTIKAKTLSKDNYTLSGVKSKIEDKLLETNDFEINDLTQQQQMLSNLIVPEDDEDELELELDDESLAFLDQINEEVKANGREKRSSKNTRSTQRIEQQHRDHQRHVKNDERSTTRTKSCSKRSKDKDTGFELG